MSTPPKPTMKTFTKPEPESKRARTDSGTASASSAAVSAPEDGGKAAYALYMALKILWEEYLMQPKSDHEESFFHLLPVGVDLGRSKLPIIQILDEHVEESPLAKALVVKYENGKMFCSPKGLKWVGERVVALLANVVFRADFCLGEPVLVARSERGGKVTRKYLFKATDDMLSKLGVELSKLGVEAVTAWQRAYLEYNPYFKMEVTTKEGTTTRELKFKPSFNEAMDGEWTDGSGAAFIRTFVTETLGSNPDLGRYGDTWGVEHDPQVSGLLHAAYGLVPSSVATSFTQEELNKHNIFSRDKKENVRAPYKEEGGKVVPLPPAKVTDFESCTGLGSYFTRKSGATMQVKKKREDRYFGAPVGVELQPSALLVFGKNLLEHVDESVKEAGVELAAKLASVQRMEHVMQREGVDPIDKIRMRFASYPPSESPSESWGWRDY